MSQLLAGSLEADPMQGKGKALYTMLQQYFVRSKLCCICRYKRKYGQGRKKGSAAPGIGP